MPPINEDIAYEVSVNHLIPLLYPFWVRSLEMWVLCRDLHFAGFIRGTAVPNIGFAGGACIRDREIQVPEYINLWEVCVPSIMVNLVVIVSAVV